MPGLQEGPSTGPSQQMPPRAPSAVLELGPPCRAGRVWTKARGSCAPAWTSHGLASGKQGRNLGRGRVRGHRALSEEGQCRELSGSDVSGEWGVRP